MWSKKGFTLLELVIVIIIIGILASLGLTQYGKMIEKSRGAEAKQILGQIRTMAAGHYLQYNDLKDTNDPFDNAAAGIGTANDQIPSACRASHYFSYAISVGSSTKLTITATRCGSSGKGGNSPAAGRTLTLTSTFPAGTDTWGGGGGY